MGRMDFRSLLISDWPWQVAVGVSSTLGFICLLSAIISLPISVAMPLIYTYPALGALMAPIINREKPTAVDWLAISIAVVGVILLAYGATDPDAPGGASWTGVAWGLAGAFWIGLMINLTRRQAKARATHVILFYLFAVNLTICLPVMLAVDGFYFPAFDAAATLYLLIAPANVLALLLMSKAYCYIYAYHGGVILTLEAVFAAFFGIIFLKEPLLVWAVMGGLLMITSSVMISLSARPQVKTAQE